MQLKFAGPATVWFRRLNEYDRSWRGWKSAFTRFTGKEALSITIWGLPLELQVNARVFKCRTADELYSVFLADLDHYQETSRREPDLKRRLQEKVRLTDLRRRDLVKRLKVRCHNCQELDTHLSQNCPKSKANLYRRCGRTGHNV